MGGPRRVQLPPPQGLGRNRLGPAQHLPVARAFVADEVEDLVADDGAAHGAAVLVIAPRALFRARRSEVLLRPQLFVRVELERRSAEVVRSALDLRVDGGSAG